jgi:hypothetical protein
MDNRFYEGVRRRGRKEPKTRHAGCSSASDRPRVDRSAFCSIPRVDEKHDCPPPIARDPKVTWLPAPKIGYVVLLGLLYSGHGEVRPAEASGQDIREVGHLDLRNGERVWVTRSEKAMTPEAIEGLRELREPLSVHLDTGTDTGDVGGSLMLIHTPVGGGVAFTEIVLGRHLLHQEPAP